jgi:GT2 family glycosyltransferase
VLDGDRDDAAAGTMSALWCTQVELAGDEPEVLQAPADSFVRARCLVRLHGDPLGYVQLPLVDGVLRVEDLMAEARATLSERAVAHLLAEGLDGNAFRLGRLSEARALSCPSLVSSDLGVSVVVCTRNRAEQLRSCLSGLRALTYPHLEVVVVDNAAADTTTKAVFDEEVGGDDRFVYVTEPRPGLSCARNRGLAAAQGTVVAYTDDDVEVDPEWVQGLVRGFAEGPEVGCVTGLVCAASLNGAAELYFDSRLDWSESCEPRRYDMSPALQDGLYPYSPGRFGTGANFAVRRDVMVALGGFDEALGAGTPSGGGEDLDAFVRVLLAGHALVYEPAAIVWHHHRDTVAGLRKQMFSYGSGFTAFLTKHLIQGDTRGILLQRIAPGLRRMAKVPRKTRTDTSSAEVFVRGLLLTELHGYIEGPWRYLVRRGRSGARRAARAAA